MAVSSICFLFLFLSITTLGNASDPYIDKLNADKLSHLFNESVAVHHGHFANMNATEIYDSTRRLLRYFEGYEDEEYAQYDDDEIDYDQVMEMMEWIETLSEEELMYYYDMMLDPPPGASTPDATAKVYDVIIIRHPYSDGNKYDTGFFAGTSANIKCYDAPTARPEGMQQIKALADNFMTQLTAAKPAIAAKLTAGNYLLHTSPLSRAQAVAIAAMTSIIKSSTAAASPAAAPATAPVAGEAAAATPSPPGYPKSIYISRNLQESGMAKSNKVAQQESTFQFAKAYCAARGDDCYGSGAIGADVLAKLTAWQNDKFLKVKSPSYLPKDKNGKIDPPTKDTTTMAEWGIAEGFEANKAMTKNGKLDVHSKLNPGSYKYTRLLLKHIWQNGYSRTMRKWAWNLRLNDNDKDTGTFVPGTDATVPKSGDVVVVGGHSSVIKGFMGDYDMDWSAVQPAGADSDTNAYTKLIKDTLDTIATADNRGTYSLSVDTSKKTHLLKRAMKDMSHNKLLNCQAVYMRMEVSGKKWKDAKIKVLDFAPVYKPPQNLWT